MIHIYQKKSSNPYMDHFLIANYSIHHHHHNILIFIIPFFGFGRPLFYITVKNSIDRPDSDSDSEYIFVHSCMIQKLCVEKK